MLFYTYEFQSLMGHCASNLHESQDYTIAILDRTWRGHSPGSVVYMPNGEPCRFIIIDMGYLHNVLTTDKSSHPSCICNIRKNGKLANLKAFA